MFKLRIRILGSKIGRIADLFVLFQVVNDKEESIEISEKNLQDFVGKPVFTSDKMYDTTPVRFFFCRTKAFI